MPHIAPLDRSELPQFEEKFARYDAIRGFLANSILTMGRRPNIAAAFMELNQAILYEGTVPEALKMMVALMTSMATGWSCCQVNGPLLSCSRRLIPSTSSMTIQSHPPCSTMS